MAIRNILKKKTMIHQAINSNKCIAVIGANGFVGSNICNEIESQDSFNLVKVVRGDNIAEKIRTADIVIHAANPAKRYFANNNPKIDYSETIEKTEEIINLCSGKKIVLISSLSARTQLNTTYGRYRKACEILANFNKNLVIRLGPMFGGERTQDTLHEIMNGNAVYISGETKYSYTSVEYSSATVVKSLNTEGLIEIGAKNSIKLQEIADYFKTDCIFSGFDDTQIANSNTSDSQDAYEVIEYCLKSFRVNHE